MLTHNSKVFIFEPVTCNYNKSHLGNNLPSDGIKNSFITEHDFIMRIILKDIYWPLNYFHCLYIFTLLVKI